MTIDALFLDSMTELSSLGLCKAADVLNSMLDSHIVLSAPTIRIVDRLELFDSFAVSGGRDLAAVEMRYGGSMDGIVKLIFDAEDAGRLVDCIIGDESFVEEGLDAIRAGTLCEVGNIVINAILGTLANELNFHLEYSVPFFTGKNDAASLAGMDTDDSGGVLLVETIFSVEALRIAGRIAIFFSLASFGCLREAAIQYTKAEGPSVQA
jgi:chemotaxis protein CheC